MKQLTNTKAILLILLLSIVVLATLAHPVRGSESAAQEEAPFTLHLPTITHIPDSWPPLFGVQVYGSTTPTSTYTPHLLESNASWVRVPANWGLVEPANTTPANFNWSAVDAALAIAVRRSPRVIATIDSAPGWAAHHPGSPIHTEMLPDFAEFVSELVERYDGDSYKDAPGNPIVTHWEFYNEPDGSIQNWRPGWGEYGARYAEMLQIVYPVVKQANHRAQVVFAGIAYDWWQRLEGPFVESFLDDALVAGAGDYFDVMNFHYYPSFGPHWTDDGGLGLFEKAQAVRSKLQQYNLDKPLVVTEAGWHSNNDLAAPSTPENQARYVVELFVQSMAADVDVMIWWMLYDPGDWYDNGLVTIGPAPQIKPSFTAYTTIVSQLSRAKFVRSLDTPDPVAGPGGTIQSMDAYEFRDETNGRTVYVAWMNPVDGTAVWPLQLPATQATLRNIYGAASTLLDGDDGTVDGLITVPVSSQPVYVEVPW